VVHAELKSRLPVDRAIFYARHFRLEGLNRLLA
jgi:hypothetical protein